MKRAIITGITGQDGAYLADLLLKHGYEVFGTHRHSASGSFWRLDELGILERVQLVPLDLLEYGNIHRTLQRIQPHEIYNLAAQSFVGASFEQPLLTADINAMGVSRLLEAARLACPDARIYQASTSEMFGKVQAIPQNETTPFYPRSPYGVSKLYAHWAMVNARESWRMYTACGVLFNHESPQRGLHFVTRKITSTLAQWALGGRTPLELGNLEARRDWGFAGDYVEGMFRMLQQPTGDTYVLATGETRTVREFVELTAAALDIPLAWEGAGTAERAIDTRRGVPCVKINPVYYRPAEVDLLVGDPRKAKETLGWTPQVQLPGLVERMVSADLRRARLGKILW